jgi:hypothetical protein
MYCYVLHRLMYSFYISIYNMSESKAGMALVGHADANRHGLLNTRKLPVY